MTLKGSIKEFGLYLGNNESFIDLNHKHLAEKILLHWGYQEFYPFIKKLAVNDQDRKRNGFSIEVMTELYELSEIHERLFPKISRRIGEM